MASRRVVRKSAAVKKDSAPVRRGVDTKEEQENDTQIVWSDNEEARRLGINNSEPAKTVSKVVSLQISIGNSDRDYTMEEFVEYINGLLTPVPYGQDGLHASVLSSYYIVDGKVCQPSDYDAGKQHFKDGTLPPSWAGGMAQKKTVQTAERASSSSAAISAKRYDEKYGPEGSPVARGKIAEQKELARKRREGPTDDELEDIDFEWNEDTISDDEEMERVAKKSQAAAAKKIRVKKTTTPAPKKRVVAPRKKTASASSTPVKRVVRRKK